MRKIIYFLIFVFFILLVVYSLKTNIAHKPLNINRKQLNSKILLEEHGKQFIYDSDLRQIVVKTNGSTKVLAELPSNRIYTNVAVKDAFTYITKNGRKLYIFINTFGDNDNDFRVYDEFGNQVLKLSENMPRDTLNMIHDFYEKHRTLNKKDILTFLQDLDSKNMLK